MFCQAFNFLKEPKLEDTQVLEENLFILKLIFVEKQKFIDEISNNPSIHSFFTKTNQDLS